jgi:hypothetical protein
MDRIRNIVIFSGLAIAGLVLRILFLLVPARVYGDVAVFALMARRILELKEFPAYIWLAHYGGTLSSYIAAILYRILGCSAFTYNIMWLLVSIVWVVASFLLAKELLPKAGYLSALALLLMPASGLFYFSLLGIAYGESLLFGSLILLLAARLGALNKEYKAHQYILCGFVCGIGLWVMPVTAPMILSILVMFAINDKKIFTSGLFLFLVSGFIIGYIPSIIFNIQYPGAAMYRFLGRVLELDRSVLASPDVAKVVLGKALWRLSTVPASLAQIPYMLYKASGIINVLVFFVSFLLILKEEILSLSRTKKLSGIGLAAIYAILYSVFYAIFIGLPQIRYIIPLCLLMPLFAGKLLSDIAVKSKLVFTVLLAALLVENAIGINSLFMNKEVHHYKELTDHLASKNIRYGYSDYWLAYPVIFESGEKIIISPTLFHPTFDDRRPEYTKEVEMSGETAFIIDRVQYPDLSDRIESQLKEKGIGYSKDEFLEFTTYYGFSKKVSPGEFKLGEGR